ncbi:MAG: ribonuclease P [Candidatus Aenigmarchaeota archaeon]|nr:ribonuclease P [Candidatus Aenigmarchaeota archaeon]
MRSRSKPEYQLKIARERIQILFDEAEHAEDPKLAKRYIELARKIGMRYNVRIPRDLKRKYCRHCGAFLRYGANARHSVRKGVVTIKCFSCQSEMHYPYGK